jgi:hypothetical protein
VSPFFKMVRRPTRKAPTNWSRNSRAVKGPFPSSCCLRYLPSRCAVTLARNRADARRGRGQDPGGGALEEQLRNLIPPSHRVEASDGCRRALQAPLHETHAAGYESRDGGINESATIAAHHRAHESTRWYATPCRIASERPQRRLA